MNFDIMSGEIFRTQASLIIRLLDITNPLSDTQRRNYTEIVDRWLIVGQVISEKLVFGSRHQETPILL